MTPDFEADGPGPIRNDRWADAGIRLRGRAALKHALAGVAGAAGRRRYAHTSVKAPGGVEPLSMSWFLPSRGPGSGKAGSVTPRWIGDWLPSPGGELGCNGVGQLALLSERHHDFGLVPKRKRPDAAIEGFSVHEDPQSPFVAVAIGTEARLCESYSPDIEELAQGEGSLLRGLDVDHSSGVVRVQWGRDVRRDADLRRDGDPLAVHVQLQAGEDVERFAGPGKTESGHSLRHLFTIGRPRCRGSQHAWERASGCLRRRAARGEDDPEHQPGHHR